MSNKKNIIKIDDKEYNINKLSDVAKGCVNQLGDIQNQMNVAKLRLQQLEAAYSVFMAKLQGEVKEKN
tara:strand:+ start:587 stop:790 length:204 start_codon:yes stop_codon:yes gene_type:complete